jgi:hypothetical protein
VQIKTIRQTTSAPRDAMDDLAAFRATRKTGIHADYSPSDDHATEEYSYDWDGMIWCIRCERGRYVYSWTHPCNEDASTLASAESALFDMINAELS